MPKFKTSTFYSAFFDSSGQICGAFGWETEPIQIDLEGQFEMQDCYKIILDDLSDWKGTWTGEDAKWIDECSLSIGVGAVQLKSWTLTDGVSEKAVIGGTEANGEGCWKFANWTKWAPYIAQMGFNSLRDTAESWLPEENRVDPEHLNI